MLVNDIAKLIPERYRDKLLEENIIYKAIAVPSDPHMKVLYTIWKTYIEPNNTSLSMDCSYCLANILKNFKGLQDPLIELSKNDKLLDL